MSITHRTVYEDKTRQFVYLPLGDDLLKHHPNGNFALLENPCGDKAVIVGMFVLRPGEDSPFSSPLLNEDGSPNSDVFNDHYDWTYNVEGLSGGWLIANHNGVDAFRLGMQYGLSDAVIFSSNIVCSDGIDNDERPGYLWQPYNPLSWPSVSSVDPNAEEAVYNTRKLWQNMGFLSSRKYPAQIIFTWSGNHHPGSPDFLEGAVFSKKHPDGSDIEVYIMTTEQGADAIRARAGSFGLEERIESMFVIVPEKDSSMDISLIPTILREKLGMKIVNHDGGHKVLAAFCRAGALAQMNLTLCRQMTTKAVLERMTHLTAEVKAPILSSFSNRRQLFFKSLAEGKCNNGLPRSLEIASILADDADEVSVYIFDTRRGVDFYLEK